MNRFDFATFPILQTSRLTLRQITLEDSHAWLNILSDEQVIYHLSDIDAPLTSIHQITPFIAWSDRTFAEKTGIRWAITLQDSANFIGTCGFHNLDFVNRKAEIGYELDRTYWRQGIMAEALTQVINFCFLQLNLHRLAADVTAGNQASAELLRRFGFVHEGTWRETIFSKGQFRDLWQFGLLAREYPVNR
jgi:ribosomal-protein-alanine N-acetyltransferase